MTIGSAPSGPVQHGAQTFLSPTYLLTSIPGFLESITYRMLADGMLLQDIRAANATIEDWAQWGPFWAERARAHEQLADGSLASGYRRTAGEHLARASLCAHYGQFLYFAFPEMKRALVDQKVALFRRAAPFLDPPAQLLEIPYGEQRLPAYLRLPAGAGPAPCVVLVGGLDAAKEDALQFSDLCTARGLATLAFDGPGQGEAYYRGLLLDRRYHEAISAVVDALQARPDIDARRIGVIGRSLGGFLAPQAAALDARIRACVAWGALYDVGNLDAKPPLLRDGYQFLTGSPDWETTKQATSFINLARLGERITCPLYIVHGMKDNSVPYAQAERLAREAQGPTTLDLVPDSIHCNHDVAHRVRPALADWLAAQLLGAL